MWRIRRLFMRDMGLSTGLPNTLVIPARPSWGTDPIALPTVWSCTRLINTTATQMAVTARAGSQTVPLPLWLRRPEITAAQMQLRDLVSYAVVSQALAGYAAWTAAPIGTGWELVPISPRRVTATIDARDRRTWYLDGERIEYVFPASTPELRQPGLLIAPHLDVPGIAIPLGPLQAARFAVQGMLDTDAYASEIIATGRGESGNYLQTEQDITPETAARWSELWTERSQPGSGIRVLGGGLKLANTLLDPKTAQWLESREFNAQEIARLYNVPPRYLGLPSGDASTYATARDNDASLLRYCVAGFTGPIASAWSSLLPPGRTAEEDVRIVFDPSTLLQPTVQEQNEADAVAISSGIETADEVRARRALPPLNAPAKEVSGAPAAA